MTPELFREVLSADTLLSMGPFLALCAGICLVLLVDLLPGGPRFVGALFVATIAVAAGLELRLLVEPARLLFDGSFLSSPTTAVWGLLFLASALIAWCYAERYYDEERPFLGEHHVLFLTSASGMMLMAGARDLLVFFVGLELLSIPLYALAGFRRTRAESVEAGLKYFVLGAFAAGMFLFGAALLYAGTGSIRLADIVHQPQLGPTALAGVALVLASLLFKISVFPFHLWVPDVYQGSPTPVTTLMATGTKTAAFAFLLGALDLLPRQLAGALAIVALLTMAAGNLGALVQTDLKRLLAYSSVAHAGTILLAIAGALAGDPAGGARTAAIYYLAAYVVTSGGAFGLLALLEGDERRTVTIDSLRGLARRRPAIAAALALFMFSLGGIPLTGGFLGKYFVFSVAVRAGMIPIAVIAVLLSVVALAYYLRVVVAMYMREEDRPVEGAPVARPSAWIATAACALLVLALGLLPGWFLERMG